MRGLHLILALVMLHGLAACGALEIEEYDGAYRFDDWSRRGFDLDYSNVLQQHVVKLSTASTNCSGVLVGRDRVLTAAHCVLGLSTPDGFCPPRTFRANVAFDHQNALGRGPLRTTGPATISEEVVAGFEAFESVEEPEPGCVPDEDGFGDVVVVRLEDPIGDERGWARIRARDVSASSLHGVVHHPTGTPKKFLLAEVLPFVAGPRQIPMDPLNGPADPGIDPGSSGAPMFDADGFVGGVMSRESMCDGVACQLFVTLKDRADALGLVARTDDRQFGIGRFRADGTFDALFSHATNFAGPREQANAIALDEEGMITTAGFATNGFGRVLAVARYDASGLEEPTFGTLGTVMTDLTASSDETLTSVLHQDVGGEQRIVVAGHLSTPDRLAVARFDETGDLDASFGAGAPDVVDDVVTLDAPSMTNERTAEVGLDSAGRIVVAGHGQVVFDRNRPLVARLNPDGMRDTSCGEAGLFEWVPVWPDDVAQEVPSSVVVTGMAILPDMTATISSWSDTSTTSPVSARCGQVDSGAAIVSRSSRLVRTRAVRSCCPRAR